MPLPPKLSKKASKGKKKAVMAETMHDLKHGPHHGDRTHAQEVAIGMKQSGQSMYPEGGGKKKDGKKPMPFMKKGKKGDKKPKK
jgi:hypothetical protein